MTGKPTKQELTQEWDRLRAQGQTADQMLEWLLKLPQDSPFHDDNPEKAAFFQWEEKQMGIRRQMRLGMISEDQASLMSEQVSQEFSSTEPRIASQNSTLST